MTDESSPSENIPGATPQSGGGGRVRGGLLAWAAVAVALWVCVLGSIGLWVKYANSGTLAAESIYPLPGAGNVPATSPVRIGFNRPIGEGGPAVDFNLTGANGQRVGGTVTLNGTSTAAIFTPTVPMAPGAINVDIRVGDKTLRNWGFTVPDSRLPDASSASPILLVVSDSHPFDAFYPEILRAEGLTSFTTTSIEKLTRDMLAAHRIAIVSGSIGDHDKIVDLRRWVESGGKLVALRPSGELAALAGLVPLRSTLGDGYLLIDTSVPPGQGLVGETIQFHGAADLAGTTPGTTSLAMLYSDAATPANGPAATLRAIGAAGGEVAAFTFDLAKSIVLTRQGNPDWAGQERDGYDPARPDDLFFGGATADPRPDYVDLNKVAIPQADEQMRLLSNIIGHMARDGAPVPKFWYFPNGAKAALVMVADDHGTRAGTETFFDMLRTLSPDGCDVSAWQCPRATSWMYDDSGMTDRQASVYYAQGFDIGSHISTDCRNWNEAALDASFSHGLETFRLVFPSLPPQQGSRLHCVAWSDYVSQVKVERNWGIRFDMNYYYWPKSWVAGRAGFMTGSGLPMRFSDPRGGLIDVYQQATHLVDEVFDDRLDAVEALLDRALGPEGYFGAFGTHVDFHNDFDRQLIGLASKRRVPMVSAQQMLDWVDGRSMSTFDAKGWDGHVFTFDIRADKRVDKTLQAMLPMTGAGGRLLEVRRGDALVAVETQTIKGIEYGLFQGLGGTYAARYGEQTLSNQ